MGDPAQDGQKSKPGGWSLEAGGAAGVSTRAGGREAAAGRPEMGGGAAGDPGAGGAGQDGGEIGCQRGEPEKCDPGLREDRPGDPGAESDRGGAGVGDCQPASETVAAIETGYVVP